MTTINPVFPSRKWAVRAGSERWIDEKDMDWCADTTSAHDIVEFHDRHTGWYTCEDPSRDDLYVGAVIRLKGRRGYLAAYQEKCNDGYLVDFSTIHATAEEAAWAGDQLAERYAEKEREYQEAWQHGNRARDYIDKADAIREKLIKRLRSLNEMKRLVREEVQEELAEIYRMRHKRDKMRDECWTGLRDAFDEGYDR